MQSILCKHKGKPPKNTFSVLTIIHAVMLIMQVLLAIASFYMIATDQNNSAADGHNEILQIVVPVFMLASFVGGSFLVKSQLKILKGKTELKDKMSGYRGLFIIKLALLEAPALFSIICFYLTNNYLFLGLASLVVCVFVLQRPTRHGIAYDLELSIGDRALLDNNEAIVAESRPRE
jgi:hypothetical protein